MTTLIEFENSATKMITEILNEYRQRLIDVDIHTVFIGPKRTTFGTGEIDDSEVEIRFVDNEIIVDILEFHLIRNSMQIVSLSELDSWLRDNIEDLINSRNESSANRES